MTVRLRVFGKLAVIFRHNVARKIFRLTLRRVKIIDSLPHPFVGADVVVDVESAVGNGNQQIGVAHCVTLRGKFGVINRALEVHAMIFAFALRSLKLNVIHCAAIKSFGKRVGKRRRLLREVGQRLIICPRVENFFIRLLKLAHVNHIAHNGRIFHAPPNRQVIIAQSLKVVGKLNRLLNVFVRAEGTQLRKPDIHQQGVAESRIVPLADKRNDGHSHIQCVASRAAAGVWERVKRDVHLLITLDVFDG